MNKRQKKKAFKKRFGFNPPRNISVKTATKIVECRQSIIAEIKRLKDAILSWWELVKQPVLDLINAFKEIQKLPITSADKTRRQYMTIENMRTKILLQQREREVISIEGDFNIHNHDKR